MPVERCYREIYLVGYLTARTASPQHRRTASDSESCTILIAPQRHSALLECRPNDAANMESAPNSDLPNQNVVANVPARLTSGLSAQRVAGRGVAPRSSGANAFLETRQKLDRNSAAAFCWNTEWSALRICLSRVNTTIENSTMSLARSISPSALVRLV